VDVPDAQAFSEACLRELFSDSFAIADTILKRLDEAGDPYDCRDEMAAFMQEYLLQYLLNYKKSTRYYRVLG
jgi:hypothetical protein